MRTARSSLIVLSVLSATAPLRADDKHGEFAELAQALLSSIQNEDIVEYTSCWLSFRASRASVPTDSGKPTKERIARMEQYIRNRNKTIAKSFRVINEALRDNHVDKQTLNIISVDAEVHERRGAKRVHDFTFKIGSSAGEITFQVDDGAFVNSLWYLTDSPKTLQIREKCYSFEVDDTE